VTDLIRNTKQNLDEANPASIEDVRARAKPLVRFSDEVFEQHVELKRFLNENLYRHEKVRIMTDNAKDRVRELFQRYMREPREMAPDFSGPATLRDCDEGQRARIVCDYIAGMTDRFAIAEHERLTGC
jgi:dGTPase